MCSRCFVNGEGKKEGGRVWRDERKDGSKMWQQNFLHFAFYFSACSSDRLQKRLYDRQTQYISSKGKGGSRHLHPVQKTVARVAEVLKFRGRMSLRPCLSVHPGASTRHTTPWITIYLSSSRRRSPFITHTGKPKATPPLLSSPPPARHHHQQHHQPSALHALTSAKKKKEPWQTALSNSGRSSPPCPSRRLGCR